MYIAVTDFKDNESEVIYKKGDLFPIKGKVKEDRIKYLLSDIDLLGGPAIKEMTKKDITDELDKRNIQYDKKSNKDVLLALLEG